MLLKGSGIKLREWLKCLRIFFPFYLELATLKKVIELLADWKTGKPLAQFWLHSDLMSSFGASRLGFGVSIPLRLQLQLQHYSCKLFRISVGAKAEAAAVFQISSNKEIRRIYQIEEMSKEWSGLVIQITFLTLQFKPFVATLLGLFVNVDFQMDPIGYEASAGFEVALGYSKGRGWFTEFNKEWQLVKHQGNVVSSGSQAFVMIGIKPMIGFRFFVGVGISKISPLQIQVAEAGLALFGVFDISAYAKESADGSNKKLCVRLGLMYGINFSCGIGLKLSEPFSWNILGPFTFWKDLWKQKREFSWCPLGNPAISLPGKDKYGSSVSRTKKL